MERTETELTLEELMPKLEREHDAEPDDHIREAIWKLIGDVEAYLLERAERRRSK